VDLRLGPENIQNAVETALALAGQPGLKPAGRPGEFHLPVLTGSWSLCADGLAHPHTGTIRPIAFDHSVTVGRDDVVLCHLNHRLVQMSLRLLRAEIWSQTGGSKLNRFTARMVANSALQTPAVLVHGRLLVLGGDNQRLHEELLIAGGQLREGRLQRLNVGEVQAAMASATAQPVPEAIRRRLIGLWPEMEAAALQALEARMQDRTKNLRSRLDERSTREVANITAVFDELKKSILETLNTKDDSQLQFDWTAEEKSQRERDIGSLRARLQELPAELAREVAHLKSRYRDPQPRLFPVAVTFLVPPQAISSGGPQ
jgi:hypothetical protein